MGNRRHKSIIILLLLVLFMPAAAVKADMPEINGSSAITFDLDTDEIIFTKDIDATMYPASITKLLTALVFSDLYGSRRTEYLRYVPEGRLMVPYSIHSNLRNIPNDEEISANDLMITLLLGSANDAAVVIAINVAGTVEDFVDLMNAKARDLGMMNSRFRNPTGLHDPDHYSTAFDLMLLLKASYEDPWLREVNLLPDHTAVSKNFTLGQVISKNKLLGVDPRNVFGKTGYTPEAGRCLAAVFQDQGRTLGTIILNSENDPGNSRVFTDTMAISDASFLEERSIRVARSQEVGILTVQYKPYRYFGADRSIEIPAIAADTISYFSNDVNQRESTIEHVFKDLDPRTIEVGTEIGHVLYRDKTTSRTVALLSTVNVQEEILKRHLLSYVLLIAGALLFLVLLIGFLLAQRRKRLHRRRRLEQSRRHRARQQRGTKPGER